MLESQTLDRFDFNTLDPSDIVRSLSRVVFNGEKHSEVDFHRRGRGIWRKGKLPMESQDKAAALPNFKNKIDKGIEVG